MVKVVSSSERTATWSHNMLCQPTTLEGTASSTVRHRRKLSRSAAKYGPRRTPVWSSRLVAPPSANTSTSWLEESVKGSVKPAQKPVTDNLDNFDNLGRRISFNFLPGSRGRNSLQ